MNVIYSDFNHLKKPFDFVDIVYNLRYQILNLNSSPITLWKKHNNVISNIVIPYPYPTEERWRLLLNFVRITSEDFVFDEEGNDLNNRPDWTLGKIKKYKNLRYDNVEYDDNIVFDNANERTKFIDHHIVFLGYEAVSSIQPNNVVQNFKIGNYNCLLLPVKNWFNKKVLELEKKDKNPSTKRLIQKYKKNSLDADILNKRFYESGVSTENMKIIADKLKINIRVKMPFDEIYDFVKTNNATKTFTFNNSKLNHLDLNELENNTPPEKVDTVKMLKIYKKLKKNDEYFWYKKSGSKITEIITNKKVFRLDNPYSKIVLDFEENTGLSNTKLDDVTDMNLSNFIRKGCRFNLCLDNQDNYEKLKNGGEYKHIDQKKAYASFKTCRWYNGFPYKITDFRKCSKIEGTGYYKIDNIKFSNNMIRSLNDWLKIYHNEGIYTSVELQFLTDNGVEYTILEGAYGSKFDWEFNDIMLNGKDDEGIRHYCRYIGNGFCSNMYKTMYIDTEDQVFVENLYANIGANKMDKVCDGTYRALYKKQNNYHNSTIVGFVLAYTRLNMLDQLLEFNDLDQIYRVNVDGIYYDADAEIDIKNCFRLEEKAIKLNSPSDSYVTEYWNDDVEEQLKNQELEIGNIRKFNLLEVHTGEGGSGKTTFNLLDVGLMKICYISPTWKLAKNKAEEYEEINNGKKLSINTIAKLVNGRPDHINKLKRYYSTLLIDEISMMLDSQKNDIIKKFSGFRIIFCGDLNYQLLPIEDAIQFQINEIPEIKHTKNYRVNNGDILAKYLLEIRNIMDTDNSVLPYILDTFKNINKNEINYNFEKDLILCSTNSIKNEYTEKYKHLEKYYVLECNARYSTGQILLKKPENTKVELRHGYTIHSIQGESAIGNIFIDIRKMRDNRILYTAISRSKKWDNIYIII